MMSVFVCGLSMPHSMMVVATSTSSSSGAENSSITLLQRVLVHLPVRHAHARLPGCRLHASHCFLDGAHAVGDVVHLPASGKLAPDGGADHIGIPLAHVHLDGASIVRRREDEAHVAHARQRHLHGARDGRCRKREHVDALAQVLHLLLVAHAEALLFVDDHQAQVMRVHIARQQAMRAYQHIHARRPRNP